MNNDSKKHEYEGLQEIVLSSNIISYKGIIIFIFSFIFLSVTISTFIKYPEKIIGNVFIVSNKQINTIYSPNNGEVNILIKENKFIHEGELLALINNPTNYEDLVILKSQLNLIDIDNLDFTLPKFNSKIELKLGEIEKHYYIFLLSLIEYNNLIKIDVARQKINNLKDKIRQNKEKLEINEASKITFVNKYKILKNSFKIDSSLFAANAIIEDKLIKSKLDLLNSKENELIIRKNTQELSHYNEEIDGEIQLLKKEKEKTKASILFNLKKSFFELKTAIDFWEYNYSIKAPVSGKIEFYQPFLNSTQYVKKDTPIFILLPKIDSLYARGIMSAHGYGKIKLLDTVFIKLKDYPYKEYGELEGIINNKSKVYHDSIYFIDIKLSKGLITNHNNKIEFSYNMAGEVEYFTNKRSILERVFSDIQNSIQD